MIRSALVALLLAFAVLPARAGELAAVLDDVRALKAGPTGVWLEGVTLRLGHLEVELTGGIVVPWSTRSGTVAGYSFHGSGTWRYGVDDPSDLEAFRSNAKRLSRPLGAGGRLEVPFTAMLALFTGPAVEELAVAANGATEPKPIPSGAAQEIGDFAGRLFTELLPFDHLYAEAKLNGRGSWASALFSKDGKLFRWERDSLRYHHESLLYYRDYGWLDTTALETISSQRLDRSGSPPPAWLVLKHAVLDVRTQDNRTGSIDSELTLTSTLGASTRVVPLVLLNNRDPESYAWNSTRRKLDVGRVVGAGEPAEFSHRYHEILVEVPEGAAAGREIVLKFETSGDVFTDISGRHGDNYFELFAAPWYPRPRGWDATLATFSLKVRTKKPWRPVTSGTETALREDGDFYELEASSDRPSDWIAVFAGKYVTREEVFGKIKVRVHAYAMARKNVIANLPKLAAAFLGFYEAQLGPYPYAELDIVEVPEYGFGIAPSGMVLITTEAWQARRDDLAKLASRGINARLAHEIAHQWFGHLAKPASSEENWLSESFSEYWSALAMGAANPDERKVQGFTSLVAEWKGESSTCRDVASLSSANDLGGESGWRDRYCLLYNRGPLVLQMLRTMVGNERFAAISRRFLEKAAHGPATTDLLARTAREVTGVDLSWFFDDWVRRGGFPTVTVEHKVEPREGGKTVLRGQARQAPGDDFRRVLVPLVIEYPNGRREVRLVLQDQAVKPFEFPLDATPKAVEVDPGKNNLVSYR